MLADQEFARPEDESIENEDVKMDLGIQGERIINKDIRVNVGVTAVMDKTRWWVCDRSDMWRADA